MLLRLLLLPAGSEVRQVRILTDLLTTSTTSVRFDSLKSEANVVAADQFFLSHAHCDHLVIETSVFPCSKCLFRLVWTF